MILLLQCYNMDISNSSDSSNISNISDIRNSSDISDIGYICIRKDRFYCINYNVNVIVQNVEKYLNRKKFNKTLI